MLNNFSFRWFSLLCANRECFLFHHGTMVNNFISGTAQHRDIEELYWDACVCLLNLHCAYIYFYLVRFFLFFYVLPLVVTRNNNFEHTCLNQNRIYKRNLIVAQRRKKLLFFVTVKTTKLQLKLLTQKYLYEYMWI